MKTVVKIWYRDVIRPPRGESLLGRFAIDCHGADGGTPVSDPNGPRELHTMEAHEFADAELIGDFIQRSVAVIGDRSRDKFAEPVEYRMLIETLREQRGGWKREGVAAGG